MARLDSDSGSLAPEPILSHLAIPPPQDREHGAEWNGGNQEILQRVVENERVHVHGEGRSRQKEQLRHETAQSIWGSYW